MMRINHRPVSIMVVYAVSLHLVWAVCIWADRSAEGATAVHAISRWITSPSLLTLSITAAALLALVGIFTRVPWIVLLLLPQQILLMMSGAGAIEAIWLAQFADGVIRSRAFIAADQMYSVLAAIGHTIAIIAHAQRIVR